MFCLGFVSLGFVFFGLLCFMAMFSFRFNVFGLQKSFGSEGRACEETLRAAPVLDADSSNHLQGHVTGWLMLDHQ